MGEQLNIQELIASGTLEAYVLGTLPEAEVAEVQALVARHPALLQEVEAIEASLMTYAAEVQPIGPGEDVLTGALAAIDRESRRSTAAAWPRYLAAAAVVLLLISALLNAYFYTRLQQAGQRLALLEQENEQFTQTRDSLIQDLDLNQRLLVHLQDPQTKRIPLVPTPNRSGSVQVLWNPLTGQVAVQNYQLPAIGPDEQYQLWAIIDGQPVDAGLITLDGSPTFLKPVSGAATAFAITREPLGGSTTPSLDEMYVFGEVAA
ncbi:MAG: anti-sigma factor [Bacteroidia bacterium]